MSGASAAGVGAPGAATGNGAAAGAGVEAGEAAGCSGGVRVGRGRASLGVAASVERSAGTGRWTALLAVSLPRQQGGA